MSAAAFRVRCSECGGFHEPRDCAAFDELLELACDALDETTTEIYEAFDMTMPGGRWAMDDDVGAIVFTRPDGRSCMSEFDFVGTWAVGPKSFKWGWEHPYATEATRAAADRVLEEGRAIGSEVMTTNLLETDESEVWHLAKIAAYLAGRPATYRVRANEKAWMYLALARPRWSDA